MVLLFWPFSMSHPVYWASKTEANPPRVKTTNVLSPGMMGQERGQAMREMYCFSTKMTQLCDIINLGECKCHSTSSSNSGYCAMRMSGQLCENEEDDCTRMPCQGKVKYQHLRHQTELRHI